MEGRGRSFVPDPSDARGICGLVVDRAALPRPRTGETAGAGPSTSKRARGAEAEAGAGAEERVLEVAGAGTEGEGGDAVAGSPQPRSPMAVAVVQVEGGAARPVGADESLRDQNAALVDQNAVLVRQLGEAQAALDQRAERDSVVEARLLALQHARRALRGTPTHTHTHTHTHTLKLHQKINAPLNILST